MRDIRAKKVETYFPIPLLVEVFYHICKLKGKDAAQTSIAHLLKTFPIQFTPINTSLIYKAGSLRCQHRGILSYNDCMAIALALNTGSELHTTEKHLTEYIPRLKVKVYEF